MKVMGKALGLYPSARDVRDSVVTTVSNNGAHTRKSLRE